MSAFLKALALIPQILPIIYAFVQQADAALASAPGTAKFQTVLAAVQAYITKLETDSAVVAELAKLVQPLIEGVVAFWHAPSTATAVNAVAPTTANGATS